MTTFNTIDLDTTELQAVQQLLEQDFTELKSQSLELDLTRGKPGSDQLTLSNAMDGILAGNYISDSGTDTRNYGGLDGLPEVKSLFAQVLEVDANNIIIGGNSSLTMMYNTVLFALIFGLNSERSTWAQHSEVKFLCPVPGYDRHFSICEELGIKMIPVAMTDTGPDMDEVEAHINNDPNIKGMWCVPRFSNPTGVVYDNETVRRIAKLGKIAGPDFLVLWDNAYALHAFEDNSPELVPIIDYCQEFNTESNVIQFGSTSKVTFASAGLAYMSSSKTVLDNYKKHLGISSIGPDKVNQLRHLKFFSDFAGLRAHMQKHAALLKPRFDIVLTALNEHFLDSDALSWTVPKGGYFVSVDTQEGLASRVVELAAELGVKLTPAGATFPYGDDPADQNLRIAPSFPSVEDITLAMQAFVICVKLATVEKALA